MWREYRVIENGDVKLGRVLVRESFGLEVGQKRGGGGTEESKKK